MKIIIKSNGNTKYVYHHPRDVRLMKKSNKVIVGSDDPMEYYLTEDPKVYWTPNKDEEELVIELNVKG